MRIDGRLTGATSGYAGHRIEALIPVRRDDGAGGSTQDLVPLVADTDDAGRFTLTLADELKPQGKAELAVRSPAGVRMGLHDVDISGGGLILLAVPPQPKVPVDVEPNALAASLGPVTVAVQLVDRRVPSRAANQLVSLWGRPTLEIDEDDADAPIVPDRFVLGAAYADARGLATISIPRQRYTRLEVVVPASSTAPTAVPIDDGGLPAGRVTATVSLPEPPDASQDDCECKDGVVTPRTPGHDELVGGLGVYSTDLGVGTCPTPAVPNRTLEEYRYYSLVRVTDPVLVRGERPRPTPLSDNGLKLAADLAYGFQSMDAALKPRSGAAALMRTEVRDTAVTASLDSLRMSSPTYRSSGLINARAWRETADVNEVQRAILERASTLSEQTLRAALADPDGFTPATLMTAERAGAFDALGRTLDVELGANLGRRPISTDNMPRWDAAPRTYQAATIAHGHVLEWRQVWRADGYSLGDLVYSLPLAPGQKRKLVVLDWDRRESGVRSESRAFAESFRADLSRDRAVAEIVNSTVTESIRAGSKTNTWAAGGGLGLGIPIGPGFLGLGVAGGGGGSSSTAWQDSARSLSAYAGQQLSDRTQQASSAVRSQRATVVVGQQQSESVSVTSEVVANYNHCHALTVEYFEVLKHYRVDQELAAVSECLFVPLLMSRFDDLKALRWRDTLQMFLRDRSLRGGFDAIERIVTGYADTDFPAGRHADELVREMNGELRFELDIQRPRPQREGEDIQAYLNSTWNFWTTMFGADAARAAYDSTITDAALADRIFTDELAPRVARAYCDGLALGLLIDRGGAAPVKEMVPCDFTMVSDYRRGATHLVSCRVTALPAQPFTRAQVRGVYVESSLPGVPPGSRTILRHAYVGYRTDRRSFALVGGRGVRNDVEPNDPAFLSTRSLSRGEEFNPRANDLELRDGLLKHLNELVEHYHHLIWWRMDPNRRFMLLDGYVAPNSGNRSVASVTENRLLSIVGNCLVLPVAPGFMLDPAVTNAAAEDRPIDLVEAYRPVIPFPPKRISVPTRGVHAEAIQGECNSCERVDNKRFWDWASEPTGDEPPDILESSTSTRRQTPPDTTPTAFPSPIVAIQNTPSAPDPTGLSAITALLGQKDLFKDVTGLEGNQANALGAFQRAMQTANFFGKLAAGGAKAAHANRQGERVMQKLQDAERSGLVNKDDAKSVASKLFGVMNADISGKDKQLPAEPSVLDSLKTFLGGPGKKTLSVSQGSGNQTQSVDARFDNGSASASGAKPAIDVVIAGVPPIHQGKSRGCWAAGVAMLRSHARQQSLTIDTVLAEVGAPYPAMYANDTGLKPSETAAFMTAFGLRDASIGALTADMIAAQLRSRGPLWVVVDEDPATTFAVHARLVTGIRGDGSPGDTEVIYNNPASGTEEREPLNTFIAKAQQLANGLNSAFGGYSPTILSL